MWAGSAGFTGGCLAAVSFLVAVTCSTVAPPSHVEYCEAEDFKPKCPPGHVIKVRYARYGRMRLGRCVQTDYGNVGCNRDVVKILDAKCSGRHRCQVTLPNTDLDITKPCPREFKTYLEANYTCMRVAASECALCRGESGAALLTSQTGSIASIVTHDENNKGCGTVTCPWRVKVKSGQRINVTLHDYASGLREKPTGPGDVDYCYKYGEISEIEERKKPICGGSEAVKHVFTSETNQIDIHIYQADKARTNYFVLHYEAFGCPDLQPVQNAVIERRGDTVTVRCRFSPAHRTLTCRDNRWIGSVGTCPDSTMASRQGDSATLPIGVLVAIVIGIAFVIGVCILTIGLVCLKRHQQDTMVYRRPPSGASMYIRRPPDTEFREEIETHSILTKKDSSSESEKYHTSLAFRENVYAPGIESRPLPSIPNIKEAAETCAEVTPRTTGAHGRGDHYGCAHASSSSGGCRMVAPDDPQYFVLDPDELRIEHVDEKTALTNSSIAQKYGSQKSPEEENAENLGIEVARLYKSCQDIPGCSKRTEFQIADCSAAEVGNSTGNANSSWP